MKKASFLAVLAALALPPALPAETWKNVSLVDAMCAGKDAVKAGKVWDEFIKDPGPVVVGAVQGASCYGPAYEFAFIMDTDLRRRRIRPKCPGCGRTMPPM